MPSETDIMRQSGSLSSSGTDIAKLLEEKSSSLTNQENSNNNDIHKYE